MKKIYLSLLVGTMVSSSIFAQRAANQENFSADLGKMNQQTNKNVGDTIDNHFVMGTPTVFTSASGYVAGQNNFGDLSKMQLFDATHGLTSTNGTITSILFWFAHVEGNPTSIVEATIWADNSGMPGNALGTVPVTYQSIDTAVANTMTNGVIAWNAVATFPTPIAIPANQKFWAGIGLIYNAGDTVGLVTTSDATGGDAPGVTGNFPDAVTHTFEEWSDNSFHSFNDGTAASWQLDIALAVFPVLDLVTSVNELSANTSFNVFPNPSNDIFNISLDSKTTEVINLTVTNLVGQSILTKKVTVSGQTKETISLANFDKGIYFLTIDNNNEKQTVKLIVE